MPGITMPYNELLYYPSFLRVHKKSLVFWNLIHVIRFNSCNLSHKKQLR